MNLWKVVAALAVVLVPGGSLVLLAMAAAKMLAVRSAARAPNA